MLKKSFLPIIFAIFSFIIFMILNSILLIDNIFIRILYIIPTFIYLLLVVLSIICKMNKKTVNIISLFLLVLFAFYFGGVMLYASFEEGVSGVYDIKKYSKIYNKSYEVLPANIPESALDVEFFYSPGFLQASSIVSLYYKIDDQTIQNYINQFKEKSILTKKYSELDSIEDNYYISKNFYNYTPYKNKELPESFTLYYLKGECDASGYCNHGSYQVAAISESTNEVIFVVNEW